MPREVNLKGIAAVPLVIGTFIGGCGAATVPETLPSVALPERALSSLPAEAAKTWRLIQSDGPFPYRRDGVVFQNRERLLPPQKRGYYHEYTVPTPGSRDRGARRLVTGSDVDELYYTGDHYRSFVVVDVKQ
ncbi:ribonuclease domain-containing protein [Nonomuraea sp. NPDC059194]|uniref:ribonuclease domain-containing protein n=1 Tax=Nonomuraea sp. NPDC059194 TaxID=3346764 RepID=UPI0036893FAD